MRASSLYAGRTSVMLGLASPLSGFGAWSDGAAEGADPGAGSEDIRRMVVGRVGREAPTRGQDCERSGPQRRVGQGGAERHRPTTVGEGAPDHDERRDRQTQQ